MKHQEGYFQNDQNQSIFYQYWLPDGRIKAYFLICIGLNEQCGRYQNVADFFTKHGIGVFSFDHIGHGKSDGTRSFVKDYSVLINPIHRCLDIINDQLPEAPIFIVGHSMGGNITANFMIDHQDRIDGAILSGSLVKIPDYVTETTIKLGELFSKYLPKLRLIGVDSEGLSKDPEVVREYNTDPLVYNGKSTARLMNLINEGINNIAENGSTITKPILLLHGGLDRLCEPAASVYLHNLVSSQNNQLIIYDELYHEIYNEPEQEMVFKDILTWVNEQLG